MENLDLYQKVRSVPDSAKKTIKGGRTSGMTDINPMWRIKVLTEQFGPCGIGWYYIPTNKWLETAGNEIAAFVDIELYIKVDGEWSKPISGNGGSMFASKEKSGIYVSDECYKMATTDAISVACKQLGIGADVYWGSDRTKYSNEQIPESKSEKSISKEKKLTEEQVNDLIAECDRTGKHWRVICSLYAVEKFSDMVESQYRDCIKRFKSTPDKPSNDNPAPPDNMQDSGLPWN
jgi:hypothetical protein